MIVAEVGVGIVEPISPVPSNTPLDLPASVAHAWVLKVAPDAKICQGFAARDALKPDGYGWFDKVAVVVDTSESGAIAIYRSDGKYWLLWTDYRGGGR